MKESFSLAQTIIPCWPWPAGLRVAQWQPRVSVLARGEPLEGALIVLDGKVHRLPGCWELAFYVVRSRRYCRS